MMSPPPASNTDGIIVADNEVLIRSLVRSILVPIGLPIFLANDGTEAIRFARRTAARMVLLDFRMPNSDGLATCRAIRTLPGYSQTPVILLTGFDDNRLRAEALAVGVTRVLAKPIAPVELLHHIAECLGGAKNMKSVPPLGNAQDLQRTKVPASRILNEHPTLRAGRDILGVYREGRHSPNAG